MNGLIPLMLLIAAGLAGLLFMGFLLRIATQIGWTIEAMSVLMSGLDEFFGRPGISRGCCLVVLLFILMGCAGCASLGIVGINCFTSPAPPGLCRLIGR